MKLDIYEINLLDMSQYKQFLGKRINNLIQWMSSRTKLLKETFDSLKNYIDMI